MKELKENHTGFYLGTVLDELIEQYELRAIKFIASQPTTVPTC